MEKLICKYDDEHGKIDLYDDEIKYHHAYKSIFPFFKFFFYFK